MPVYYRKLSKGIRYYYIFGFEGKSYRSDCIYLSKREAQQAEREKYNQLDEERRYGVDKPILLSEMIADRLKFLSIRYSNGHRIECERYLTWLLEYLGDRDIREINRKDIEDFLLDYSAKLKKRNLSNHQVNGAIKAIKSAFNYIINTHDLLMRNPAAKIKPYPIKKNLKYIPSDEEIERLKSQLNHRQAFLIDFLMETGARINEAINLTYNDIKETYLILYTNKSKNSDRTPRKIPIPDCLKGKRGVGRVFPEWNETPKFLDRTLRQNKWKIWGFHCLRHRYASKLSKAGVPIFEIMQMLGHSNLSTTQIYLQTLED